MFDAPRLHLAVTAPDLASALAGYAAAQPEIERIVSKLEHYLARHGHTVEGNAFYRHNTLVRNPMLQSKQKNLFWMGTRARRGILEIGFNAGHSALLFAAASPPECEIVCFDVGWFPYVKPCFELLSTEFPQRKLELVLGDSRFSLPKWLANHPQALFSFDVVHVDGGHDMSCLYSDVAYACMLTRPRGFIVLDDVQEAHIRSLADALCAERVCRRTDEQLATFVYPHVVLEKCLPR